MKKFDIKFNFYFKVLFIMYLIQYTHNMNENEINSSRGWCWTKPALEDPAFILNDNNNLLKINLLP